MEYDDDKERLIRLSSGDHEAFRILFTRYQPGLKKYIAFIIKSDVAAEDIVQDIFIKIWILRKQMKAINSFRAYIYHIGKNAAFDYLRGMPWSVITDHISSLSQEYHRSRHITLLPKLKVMFACWFVKCLGRGIMFF